MIIDINPLLRGETAEIDIDAVTVPAAAPDDYELLPGARIKGRIENSGGYIRLTSSVSVPYRGFCARCLDPVERTLEFEFDRTVVADRSVSDEVIEENSEEYLKTEGGMLDLDDAVSEPVYTEFPMILLCSDDCPGLCRFCGKKLGPDGRCDCGGKPETDPRWDALKGLFPDE